MSKFYPEYFQDFENMKKKKAGKQTKQSSKTVFRNSRQNRKAVKSGRGSRSHTKPNIKGLPTQISRRKKIHAKSKIKISILI